MWDLVSPDGKIKVVRHFSGHFASRDFAGSIDIPGWDFQTENRLFVEPMVFSRNSRYLAAAEVVTNLGSYDSSARVVVFDFQQKKEWFVFTDESASIESLEWTADSLQMRVVSARLGQHEELWTPRDFHFG